MQRFTSILLAFALSISFALQQSSAQTQDTTTPTTEDDSTVETLFGDKVSYSIVPSLKTTYMNETWGTLLGGHAGIILNKSILVGIGTYATLGHESVNMGYTGLVVEYRYAPHRLVHFGGSMLVGYGSAWRMNPSGFRFWGLFENIGRLFSANFIVIEPNAFAEVNMSQSLALSLGASYRYITGYRESLSTVLTNESLSGASINLGLRFRINDTPTPYAAPQQ